MQENQEPTYLAERYHLIGDLKKFWRPGEDTMHVSVDLDGLAKFIMHREKAYQTFGVLFVTRADVAAAFMDEDDEEPDWPYELSDAEMESLARRLSTYLTQQGDLYWDSLRDAANDLVLVGGNVKPKQEQAA